MKYTFSWRAKPSVNTEDMDGKQTMEIMFYKAMAQPPTPFYGSSQTFVWFGHTIAILSFIHLNTLSLVWVGRCSEHLEENYCL